MVRIILRGCNGRMGKVISNICENDEECKIVAGLDVFDTGACKYPVFKNLGECGAEADVAIDFSSVDGLDEFIDECVERRLPLVLCTTGLSGDQQAKVRKASKKIPVLRSANMSLGINTLIKFLKENSCMLSDAGFDIEIVEKHHNQKLDAPSGTAMALAAAINDSLPEKYEYVYDRTERREKRPKKEIGISAVRGGSIVGDHEFIFAGPDEVIEIKHTAYSRSIFGNGAVQAAKFLAVCEPGMYDMSDVIG
ncbi:MAG: 4-hydroxy-tetrahydrodipicolinate reductase [Lachnospiraceae bacterium]|nr:4-hydroxy-tetrahydrodipicolinate reductase [Lachnospiraceae bacterium]